MTVVAHLANGMLQGMHRIVLLPRAGAYHVFSVHSWSWFLDKTFDLEIAELLKCPPVCYFILVFLLVSSFAVVLVAHTLSSISYFGVLLYCPAEYDIKYDVVVACTFNDSSFWKG